jgi:hypothetical protein
MGEGVIHHHLLLTQTCQRCGGTGEITYESLQQEPLQPKSALIQHVKTVAELLSNKLPLGHPTVVSLLSNRRRTDHARTYKH